MAWRGRWLRSVTNSSSAPSCWVWPYSLLAASAPGLPSTPRHAIRVVQRPRLRERAMSARPLRALAGEVRGQLRAGPPRRQLAEIGWTAVRAGSTRAPRPAMRKALAPSGSEAEPANEHARRLAAPAFPTPRDPTPSTCPAHPSSAPRVVQARVLTDFPPLSTEPQPQRLVKGQDV